MNHDHFIVPSGKKIRLKNYDPGFTGHYKDKDEASAKLRKDVERLAKSNRRNDVHLCRCRRRKADQAARWFGQGGRQLPRRRADHCLLRETRRAEDHLRR